MATGKPNIIVIILFKFKWLVILPSTQPSLVIQDGLGSVFVREATELVMIYNKQVRPLEYLTLCTQFLQMVITPPAQIS
jgi:hypothetical protein